MSEKKPEPCQEINEDKVYADEPEYFRDWKKNTFCHFANNQIKMANDISWLKKLMIGLAIGIFGGVVINLFY